MPVDSANALYPGGPNKQLGNKKKDYPEWNELSTEEQNDLLSRSPHMGSPDTYNDIDRHLSEHESIRITPRKDLDRFLNEHLPDEWEKYDIEDGSAILRRKAAPTS